MLTSVEHVDDIDLLVVSGDIADDGSAAGCALVHEICAAWAAERDVPHIYSTGNHDTRSSFAEIFGSGHLGPTGDDIGERIPRGDDAAAVSTLRGLRVVTLDTLIPQRTHGRVSNAQLSWLSELLKTPAEDGTLLIFHHPPIHPPAPHWVQTIGLQDTDGLRQAIEGSDVRHILCGHLHASMSGTFGGKPVTVTPGIVTRLDLTAPAHLMRGLTGAGGTLIDLGGPFSPLVFTLQARDPQAGRLVYTYDPVAAKHVTS